MKRRKTIASAGVLLFVTSFGCGQIDANKDHKLINAENPEYSKAEKSGRFGRLEVYQIKKETELVSKQQMTEISLPGGVTAYTKDSSLVLLKPHVYLQSSLEGKRIYPTLQPDGTVAVSVSIAFLDGLYPTISSGRGSFEVPKEVQIEDKDKLSEQCKSSYLRATEQSPLGIKRDLNSYAAFPSRRVARYSLGVKGGSDACKDCIRA